MSPPRLAWNAYLAYNLRGQVQEFCQRRGFFRLYSALSGSISPSLILRGRISLSSTSFSRTSFALTARF
jgi:hypothetical protein